MAEYGGDVAGVILMHAGEDTAWISERVLSVPWWAVV